MKGSSAFSIIFLISLYLLLFLLGGECSAVLNGLAINSTLNGSLLVLSHRENITTPAKKPKLPEAHHSRNFHEGNNSLDNETQKKILAHPIRSNVTTKHAKHAARSASAAIFNPERDYNHLIRCLNDNQPQAPPTSRLSLSLRKNSKYKVVKIWFSNTSVSIFPSKTQEASAPSRSVHPPPHSSLSKPGSGGSHGNKDPRSSRVTLVTQLSFDRKTQLRAMCSGYQGPIAAVVFQGLVQNSTSPLSASEIAAIKSSATAKSVGSSMDVANGVPGKTKGASSSSPESLNILSTPWPSHENFTVDNLSREAFNRVTSLVSELDTFVEATRAAAAEGSGCDLTIMLVTEVYRTAKSRRWFPVNVMRNYARMLAYSPYIAAIDADLVASRSLARNLAAAEHGDLKQRRLLAMMDAEPPAALVLPAFIAARDSSLRRQISMTDAFVNMNKAQLRLYYDLKKLLPFDPDTVGHRPTDYRRWFRATAPYKVSWRSRYEPWFMCNRLRCTWTDIRFRGYGKNKIAYALSAAVDGFQLVVHPTSFIVHRAHPPSMAALTHAESSVRKLQNGMMSINTRLFRDVLDEMNNGSYVPKLDPAVIKCRKKLWWLNRPAVTGKA